VFQNLFQPSMKLVRNIRHGSRLRRQYDAPQTPWARMLVSVDADRAKIVALQRLASWPGPIPSPCPPESMRSSSNYGRWPIVPCVSRGQRCLTCSRARPRRGWMFSTKVKRDRQDQRRQVGKVLS
jgi:hypothetical protein